MSWLALAISWLALAMGQALGPWAGPGPALGLGRARPRAQNLLVRKLFYLTPFWPKPDKNHFQILGGSVWRYVMARRCYNQVLKRLGNVDNWQG